jgi:hypothetical protein
MQSFVQLKMAKSDDEGLSCAKAAALSLVTPMALPVTMHIAAGLIVQTY